MYNRILFKLFTPCLHEHFLMIADKQWQNEGNRYTNLTRQ